MRIVNQQAEKREVFAWTEVMGRNDDQTDRLEYMLSPVREAQSGRRPMNRYDSRNELLAAANLKNCRVTWLDS